MKRTRYEKKEIRTEPCVKCGSPSEHQWRICATKKWTPVCLKCDFEINRIVAEWAFGQTAAAPILERYRQTFGAGT